jgi:hypothetical protein
VRERHPRPVNDELGARAQRPRGAARQGIRRVGVQSPHPGRHTRGRKKGPDGIPALLCVQRVGADAARTQAPGERRDGHGAALRGEQTPAIPQHSTDLSQRRAPTSPPRGLKPRRCVMSQNKTDMRVSPASASAASLVRQVGNRQFARGWQARARNSPGWRSRRTPGARRFVTSRRPSPTRPGAAC